MNTISENPQITLNDAKQYAQKHIIELANDLIQLNQTNSIILSAYFRNLENMCLKVTYNSRLANSLAQNIATHAILEHVVESAASQNENQKLANNLLKIVRNYIKQKNSHDNDHSFMKRWASMVSNFCSKLLQEAQNG